MEPHLSTTPFGRRLLTLAHVADQARAKSRPPEKAVHKWHVFRAICTAKARIGVSERALAVLDAPLTFHPKNVLTDDDLMVFSSNRQLSLRAHGMAPATLRRRRAFLIDEGLIVRRDRPNGKRHARKYGAGEVDEAFGLDISHVVARADELEGLAKAVQAGARGLKRVRERLTIYRRDIVKVTATGIEEGLPTRPAGRGPANWLAVPDLFRDMIARSQKPGFSLPARGKNAGEAKRPRLSSFHAIGFTGSSADVRCGFAPIWSSRQSAPELVATPNLKGERTNERAVLNT